MRRSHCFLCYSIVVYHCFLCVLTFKIVEGALCIFIVIIILIDRNILSFLEGQSLTTMLTMNLRAYLIL